MQNFKKQFLKITENKIIIFIAFLFIVFVSYAKIFNSYFEADEWFAFTQFLPLTHKEYGFLDVIVKTVTDKDSLSRGLHITPLSYEIFFLNVSLFGINFAPYAILSLFLHSINSFLVFFLTKKLFNTKIKKQNFKVIIFALLSGIFFALSPVHMHAVTWAAGYGQNVLSVTFFLLSIIFFKMAFNTNRKKFLYSSILFLFLGLLTKETVVILFLLLPFMAVVEKRVFPIRLLAKLLALSLIIFILFRFAIPNIYLGVGELANRWAGNYVSSARQTVESDTGTIVSRDLSIHKNIYQELVFRSITFPIKMTSELYFPRQTILSFMRVITPIIYPLPTNIKGSEEVTKSQNYQFFINGPGNDLIIYILSTIILVLVVMWARQFFVQRKMNDFRAITIGLAIIVLGALPLVLIVLSFPRWGYDTYFDSRHYYMPSVGAAILFPFILFSIGEFLSRNLKGIRIPASPSFIILLLFLIWLANNMNVFWSSMHTIVDLTGNPRKQIIFQMKQILPELPQKAVFYIETDGLGAYGPILPFQTSVAQVLTVVYYDKNPLPDEFFSTFIFEKTGEGYKEAEGRGFGYFASKEILRKELSSKSFTTSDIYGFYYDSQKIKIKDITQSIRRETEVEK